MRSVRPVPVWVRGFMRQTHRSKPASRHSKPASLRYRKAFSSVFVPATSPDPGTDHGTHAFLDLSCPSRLPRQRGRSSMRPLCRNPMKARCRSHVGQTPWPSSGPMYSIAAFRRVDLPPVGQMRRALWAVIGRTSSGEVPGYGWRDGLRP